MTGYTQSTVFSPLILLKRFVLCVTSVSLRVRPNAAVMASASPIGEPCLSSRVWIAPRRRAVERDDLYRLQERRHQ